MADEEPRVYNGRYELRRHIARGGMAEVYLAHDRLLDRPVALKVLFPELSVDPSFVERFRREAQAAANLTHPNIVSVYDWGESDNTYFIVMEYVDGRPLSHLLRTEKTLLPDRAAAICAEVAAALSFAHRNGVIHRDVKPGNVLITNDGTVKVADFGIARAANADENLTQTGAVMGTATYFSPEQAQGTPVDARSDVYSLGVVLYELVTGRPPFSGDNAVTIAYKHVREDPVAPRSRNSAVPAAFEAIVLQAMAKDPEERYQSADELRADLLRYIQGRPVQAVAPMRATPTQTVPVTTVQSRYVADAGATTVVPATGGVVVEERPKRTALYVVLLLFLLALLALALYLLGRQAGVIGNNNSTDTVKVPNVVALDATLAQQRLEQAGFTVKQTREPHDGVDQNKVFEQDPGALSDAAKGSEVTIKVSSGNETVKVPQVVGKNVDDATAALQAAGFNVAQPKLQNDDKKPEGIVLAQDPVGGNTQKQGSTVTLTVSSGKAKVNVPDVTGMDADAAESQLRSQGFTVARTAQASDAVNAGTVISTDPAPNTQTDKGSKVTMVVSSGSATTTTAAPATTTTSVRVTVTTARSTTTTTTSATSTSTFGVTTSTTQP